MTTQSSLYFDGTGDYITISDSVSFDTTQLTVSLWLKPGTLQAGEYVALISKEGVDLDDEWSILLNTGAEPKSVRFYVNDGAWLFAESTTLISSNDDWVHIVGTKFVDNIRVFINGTLEAGKLHGVMQNGGADVVIGKNGDANDRYLNGTMDEVAIWSKVLGINDIMDLYNGGQGLYVDVDRTFPTDGGSMATSLIGLWHFDEMNGDVALDSSDNSNTGALSPGSGQPSWVENKVSASTPLRYRYDENALMWRRKYYSGYTL